MKMSVRFTALSIIALLVVISFNGVQSVGCFSESDSLQTGPYVDEIIFKIIENQDQRVLALQAGDIEMDSSFFDSVHYRTLDEDPNIDIYTAAGNGYGQLTINCAKYPLNISGFRRAFAFAYNKTASVNTLHSGIPAIEHDSLVPLPNGFCIEDQFDWHYYTPQPDIGNQILDDLNFTIDSETGYRLAPDGSSFNVTIEDVSCSCELSGKRSQIAVDALLSLSVNARARGGNFEEYITRLDNHDDYDMIFYTKYFYSNDVDWLGYEYWSEYSEVEGENPTNFANDTYDSWREQLLHGTTYEAVYEAAMEMQKILHYNVPRLVTYVNRYWQGYRIDQFTGHVEDLGRYISGPWTLRNIHKLDGTLGGTVPIAFGENPDSFNIFTANSAVSSAILDELWPSLYKLGPDLTPVPDIAESMVTETHSDNSAVPEGHIRFTFDIIRNATWSDGTPLTADDIAFTFTYQFESGYDGNPAVNDIMELLSAYAPNHYKVVIEYSTESYWHFSKFAFDYIIPVHIFNNSGGIGYEGWDTWNPVFDPTEPNVNCGPYTFSDYEEGDYYKIEKNPLFHYKGNPDDIANTTTTTNQTLTDLFWASVLTTTLVGGAGIIVLYYVVVIIPKRRKM